MSAPTALDALLDPLGRCLNAESARRIVELRTSLPVQERVDVLAERANEGVLTSDESAEYEALARSTAWRLDLDRAIAGHRRIPDGTDRA